MPVTTTRGGKLGKRVLTVLISMVWLINGLFCKVLGFVPRHQLIVARILGEEHAYVLTKIIGILEVLMFAWIIIGIWRRWNAWMQVVLIAAMNIIEAILARDLLLFGAMNAVLATVFIIVILI